MWFPIIKTKGCLYNERENNDDIPGNESKNDVLSFRCNASSQRDRSLISSMSPSITLRNWWLLSGEITIVFVSNMFTAGEWVSELINEIVSESDIEWVK